MTKRQETIWKRKMIDLEMRIARYYQREWCRTPATIPDGSFAMLAFKAGYRLAKREKVSAR